MRNVALAAGFFLFGALAGLSYFVIRKAGPENIVRFQPIDEPTAFSLENAPAESVRGKIATFSGTVNWQSRTATEAARLRQAGGVQQGESLTTGDDGAAAVEFANFGSVTMGQKTGVDIIQTLPADLVFEVASGSAEFTSFGAAPFSVRGRHLLVTITNGSVRVSTNEVNHTVTVETTDSPVVVAYNDRQFNSHVLNLGKNQTFSFDDDRRLRLY